MIKCVALLRLAVSNCIKVLYGAKSRSINRKSTQFIGAILYIVVCL